MHEIVTILIAMTPTLEAHASIATAIGVFQFSAIKAFLLASMGTVTITPALLFFWRNLVAWLMRHIYLCNRFFTWLFQYTRRRHGSRFEQYYTERDGDDRKAKRMELWKPSRFMYSLRYPGP